MSEGSEEVGEASSGSASDPRDNFRLSPPEGLDVPRTESSGSSSDDSREYDDAGSDSEDESMSDETEEDGSVSI